MKSSALYAISQAPWSNLVGNCILFNDKIITHLVDHTSHLYALLMTHEHCDVRCSPILPVLS